MREQDTNRAPTVVVVSSGADTGRRYVLDRDEVTLGRADSCDIRFDDPAVSRTHAVLRREGSVVYLADVGSSAGTLVNQVPLTGPTLLRTGDVISVAGVRLRFEDSAKRPDVTQTMAAEVHYDVGQQQAGVINNVAHDQFLIQQRENFLREVAGARTKVRYLIVLGFVLYAVGLASFAYGIISFFIEMSQIDVSHPPSKLPTPFSKEIFGVPVSLLGWALGVMGSLAMIVGLVLHVVATSRRRRVEREFGGWAP